MRSHFKKAVEMRKIVEAAFKTNLRYGIIGFAEQFAGMDNPEIVDKGGEGLAGYPFEVAAKRRHLHVYQS